MYIGGYIAMLGGVDGIFFTGGIGENSSLLREKVIAGLGWMGIDLDPAANAAAKGEQALHKAGSRAQVWILPTNEEIVVARQSRDLLAG
jgi:acetate kinase